MDRAVATVCRAAAAKLVSGAKLAEIRRSVWRYKWAVGGRFVTQPTRGPATGGVWMQADPVGSLAAAMTKVVATMEAPLNETDALKAITAAVVDTLTAVDYASISMTRDDGRIVTVAARAGLCSQVAFQFRAQRDTIRGALNLYAVRPGALDANTLHLGALFATQVAITMGWERHDEELQATLATREQIGTAIGL
jgi:hypothetical protein